MPDLNEFRRQATAQSQALHEEFGYPAREVPDIWVGQNVALNMLGGRGTEHLLGAKTASGMLEAITPEGYVLSVEDRVVFIPRESVLQLDFTNQTSTAAQRGSNNGVRIPLKGFSRARYLTIVASLMGQCGLQAVDFIGDCSAARVAA